MTEDGPPADAPRRGHPQLHPGRRAALGVPGGMPTDPLLAFHQRIDRLVGPLTRRHARRLRCGPGCHACCVDGLTVFEIEADRIRRAHPDLLAFGAPAPAGGCAFLDSAGQCRIYADRPYVCRTQGLPLRWIDEAPDGQGLAEYRDICPLNDDPEAPLEALPARACWTLGPPEAQLRALAGSSEPGAEPRRVALRALFQASTS